MIIYSRYFRLLSFGVLFGVLFANFAVLGKGNDSLHGIDFSIQTENGYFRDALPMIFRNLPSGSNLKLKYEGKDLHGSVRLEKTVSLNDDIRKTGRIEIPVDTYRWLTFKAQILKGDKVLAECGGFVKKDLQPNFKPKIRLSESLDGEWERVGLKNSWKLSWPAPEKGWQPVKVPILRLKKGDGSEEFRQARRGKIKKEDMEHVRFYRRKFQVPEKMFEKNRRIKLKFNCVHSYAEVRINGEKVGTSAIPFMPFVVDITNAARKGENELVVGVIDAVAFINREKYKGDNPFTSGIYLNQVSRRGAEIGGSVTLVGQDDVYLEQSKIDTSVEKGKMTVRLDVVNESSRTRKASPEVAVYDGDDQVAIKTGEELELAPGEKKTVSLVIPWKAKKLWWPDAPYLYYADLRLKEGENMIDRETVRFGYREITLDGKYVRMNGVKIFLSNTCPDQPADSRSDILGVFRKVLSNNTNSVWQFNPQLTTPLFLNLADETGVLIFQDLIQDKPCYDEHDERFWTNWQEFVRHFLPVLWNHPSVFCYIAEDEWLCGVYGGRRFKGIRDIVKLCKKLDPSRLSITSGPGDGDLAGTNDMIDLHYLLNPTKDANHSQPNVFRWLSPNEEESKDLKINLSFGNQKWRWRHDKPLQTCHTLPWWFRPEFPAMYLGEKAFESYVKSHAKIKKKILHMQAPLYRRAEVTCQVIWDLRPNLCTKHLFSPIAAFIWDSNKTFFSGAKIERKMTLFNSSYAKQKIELEWWLERDGRTLSDGKSSFELPAGEKEDYNLILQLPKVEKRSDYALRYQLSSDGKVVFNDKQDLSVLPKLPPAPDSWRGQIALFDPMKKSSAMFNALKIPFTPISSLGLNLISKYPCVLVGEDALKEAYSGYREPLVEYLAKGGSLVVLRQSGGFDVLPVPLEFDPCHRATMAHVVCPGHPLVEGFRDDDFMFWANDNYVTKGSVARPSEAASFQAVVASAESQKGLVYADLAKIPYGTGTIILCQMLLNDSWRNEPMARRVLFNIITRALDDAVHAKPRPSALMLNSASGKNEVTKRLQAVSLKKHPDFLRETAKGLTVLEAGENTLKYLAEHKKDLKTFLSGGGNLYIYNLKPSDASDLSKILSTQIEIKASEPLSASQPLVKKAKNDPILRGIINQDFWWAKPGSVTGLQKNNPPVYPKTLRYVVEGPENQRAKVLTSPSSLVAINEGPGLVVLDTLNWPNAPEFAASRALQYASTLLTNLGARFKAMAKKTDAVNLRPLVNAPLPTEFENFPICRKPKGWMVGLPLQPFPKNVSTPKGTFKLLNPESDQGRSALRLTEKTKAPFWIEVNRLCDAIDFLHFALRTKNGSELANCQVVMADGSELEFPLIAGKNVFNASDLGNSPAWRGETPTKSAISVHSTRWTNPTPWLAVKGLKLNARIKGEESYYLLALNAIEFKDKIANPSFKVGGVPKGKIMQGKAKAWNNLPSFYLGRRRHLLQGHDAWKNPDDLSAIVRLGANGKFIYIMIDVKDNFRRNDAHDKHAKDLYNGDCVEVFIDPRGPDKLLSPSSEEPYYQMMFVPPTPKNPKSQLQFWQPAGYQKIEGMKWKITSNRLGYLVEIAIPRAAFPKAINKMGIDIAINDCDKQARQIISWSGLGGQFADPGKLGTLVFGKELNSKNMKVKQ